MMRLKRWIIKQKSNNVLLCATFSVLILIKYFSKTYRKNITTIQTDKRHVILTSYLRNVNYFLHKYVNYVNYIHYVNYDFSF